MNKGQTLKTAIYTATVPYNNSTVLSAVDGIQYLIHGVSNNAGSSVNTIKSTGNKPIVYAEAASTTVFNVPVAAPEGEGIVVSADDVIVYYTENKLTSQGGA
tara:strand:- start:19 stop:324 length:306 start_codon:yes stop_codon:yes gene_type:complete